MNLREFLKLYSEGYTKLVKKNPKLTEEEYLKLFLSSLETHYERVNLHNPFMTSDRYK